MISYLISHNLHIALDYVDNSKVLSKSLKPEHSQSKNNLNRSSFKFQKVLLYLLVLNYIDNYTNEIILEDRFELVKANKWCTNCLGSHHNSENCSSHSSCKKCSKSHHGLLNISNGDCSLIIF